MTRPGKISVLKRGGTIEPFSRVKLRRSLLRALGGHLRDVDHADALAGAVKYYLHRRRMRCLTTRAVLEMAVTALYAAGHCQAAGRMERHHDRRAALRCRLTLRHDEGRVTAWSKDWLVQQVRQQWFIGPTVARILAGQIERDLARREAAEITRSEIEEMLAELVSSYGLAMTCPLAPAGEDA